MTQKETWKEHLAGVRQTLRCGCIAEARAALDALRGAGVVPEPEQWRIHELYGAVFHDLADAEGAAAAYFRAAATDRYLRSQREHFSNYLFALHYLPNLAADELAGQHRRYALLFRGEARLPPRVPPAHTRLRIGFLSPDFVRSSSSFFYAGLLTGLDRTRFSVYAYSLSMREDAFSSSLADSGVTMRCLAGQSLYEQAQAIRRDEIDILVDLGGHSAGGMTLMVTALRPAPVQICGIGWFDTTGLDAVDAVLTDPVMDPEPRADGARFSEKLLYLPQAFCFRPSAKMRRFRRPPRRPGSPVVFASLQNVMKISRPVLDCWRRILDDVPEARLFVQDTMRLPERCAAVRERMAGAGLPMERVTVRPGRDGYLEDYSRADILLDTFPYPGGASAATALYMGTPVVGWAGDHHSARLGASVLSAAGQQDCVASDAEEYVRLALRLAGDTEKLAVRQQALREAVRRSPLMDEEGYCRSFMQACCRLWQQKGGGEVL